MVADCTGVVLAGGTSRRFADGDKATATVDGERMVVRVVERLGAAVGEPVVVSVRTDRQREDVGAALAESGVEGVFVRDAATFEGPLAGVLAAVERAESDRVAVVACDMPLLDPGVIEWLAGVDGDAVVPVTDRPQPLQAIYRTEAVEGVADRLPPSAGPRALLEVLSVRYVPATDAPEGVAAERSLTNVNTVADLETIEGSVTVDEGDSPNH